MRNAKEIHAKNEIRRLLKGNTLRTSSVEYTHKGHKIVVETENEDDNSKKSFFVTTPEGNELNANIGPYENSETGKLWVDAGCPQIDPPQGTEWNAEQLREYISTDNMWHTDAFGEIKAHKLAKIVNERLKIAIKGPIQDGKEPNVICAWCNNPMGYDPDLEEGLKSHGVCKKCEDQFVVDNHLEGLGDYPPAAPTEESMKTAQNVVNMGAEVNNGMQPQPQAPTMEQEEQMKSDFNADFDSLRGFSNLQNFQESLSQQQKTSLLSAMQKLKATYPQLAAEVRNPQTRKYLTMFLQEMSKSDPSQVNNLKAVMRNIQQVSDRELQVALAPQTVPQQTIDQARDINPVNLRKQKR